MKEVNLELSYHENQRKIFFESDARFKIIAKGRRFGLTKGFANYVVESMIDGVSPILWVDTIYGNIERYIERYFIPALKDLPKNIWKYRVNRNDLKIGNSVCDFRSADKPENIEGFGYALIILNEAGIILKNRRLWEESIRPMLLDYKAKVLIGGTPKGKRLKRSNEKHLFYELYERGASSSLGNQWESFNFSSYDNPLIDKNEIDELANDISASLRQQEIYGHFIDEKELSIIKREWFKYYERYELEKLRIFKTVQSWDTAFKKNQENDYSVCTTWKVADNGYYLIDIWRGRVEFPELKRKVTELNELYLPNEILIEDKASGQSLIQELQRETRLPIKPIKVNTDKISRVHAVTPLIEAGKVLLKNDDSTSIIIDECEDFPNGEFDDIVDSISQFLNNEKTQTPPNLDSIVHIPRKTFYPNRYKGFRIRNKLRK